MFFFLLQSGFHCFR